MGAGPVAIGLRCPGCGSVSVDAEFCSECGASMAPAAATPAATPAAAPAPIAAPTSAPPPAAVAAPGGPELCPVCGEARPGPFARYCDNCRYDFLSKQPFAAAAEPAAAVPAAPEAPASATPLLAARWDLQATVDPSLRRPEDPMPTDLRERIFPLDLSDHLIGRRSDSEDIHPEITINDPGISRRHARILRAADGALSLLDLGSMNGTRLNGSPVEANVTTGLRDGDQMTLGCWTRLVVKAR